MAEENRWSTRNYDLAKGAVLLVVLLLLAIAVIGPNATSDRQEPTPAGVAQNRQPPPVGTAPVLSPPQTAPDGSVSLSGSAEPGSTVELWAGETNLATVPVDAGGSWSYAGRLDAGDYQLVARTVSAGGQILNESEAMPVSVPGAIALTLNKPRVSTSGKITLSGTGRPGATLEILDNGVVVASRVIGEDGTWTVRYAASAGKHTVVVQIQGRAGEGSAAAPVAVTVPATAGGHSYVVKHGDWLLQLARHFYGDPRRWIDIYEATNAKAAHDRSYHRIGNPDLLLPGWKIWIPEP